MTAHTDRHGPGGGRPTARGLRRALRREVPSTVGLLADEEDFAAMRAYRTFVFDDHATYLRHTGSVLQQLAARELHTRVALFDPQDYEWDCAATGSDPDCPARRARWTADIAAGGGAVVPYTGEPLGILLPMLVDTAVRRATQAYATAILAGLGSCAHCDEDIGRAALDHASALLRRLLDRAGPGVHQLVCSAPAADDPLVGVLRAEQPGGPPLLDDGPAAEFATVLAVAVALDTPAGIVMRTVADAVPDRLHGWRLSRGRLLPLSAAEVFNAYCTDAETGEPIGPEPGVDYRAGFDLGPGEEEFGH
ncbi:hypothetical protein [Streptomyces fuscigenes]|uniref:hypothetical protein n=1 Tax=Streptomyces fuscigenes TaxID=1528880 RepID=UPI001F343FF2|nr:hypothetical protein [Streptomyces fuscigenes]MCF3963036.1 hypothetical protein [Streptomyces fuscigenes]